MCILLCEGDFREAVRFRTEDGSTGFHYAYWCGSVLWQSEIREDPTLRHRRKRRCKQAGRNEAGKIEMRVPGLILMALIGIFVSAHFCAAQEIRVAAAADLQFAMEDIATQFQRPRCSGKISTAK
jgi:hypothetical protein